MWRLRPYISLLLFLGKRFAPFGSFGSRYQPGMILGFLKPLEYNSIDMGGPIRTEYNIYNIQRNCDVPLSEQTAQAKRTGDEDNRLRLPPGKQS